MDSDFWASRILVAWDPSRIPVNWLGPNAQDCVSGVRWELVPPFFGIVYRDPSPVCGEHVCSRVLFSLVHQACRWHLCASL